MEAPVSEVIEWLGFEYDTVGYKPGFFCRLSANFGKFIFRNLEFREKSLSLAEKSLSLEKKIVEFGWQIWYFGDEK